MHVPGLTPSEVSEIVQNYKSNEHTDEDGDTACFEFIEDDPKFIPREVLDVVEVFEWRWKLSLVKKSGL